MASEPTSRSMSVEEYLAFEKKSGIKYEYLDGEIFAMSGGTGNHSRITMNAVIAIGQQVAHSPCHVHSSDMRIKISETQYIYPDFSVVCGEDEYATDSETILVNPTLVAEVMSPSTADYDRGAKGDFYRSLPSVQAYLLFDQDRILAQLYTRHEAGWLLREFKSLDLAVPLKSIQCDLPLADVYQGINFKSKQS